MFKLFKRKKNNQALPMEPTNVLLISSSARDLWEVIEMTKSKYVTNSDPLKLDNGDFAMVIKRRKIDGK